MTYQSATYPLDAYRVTDEQMTTMTRAMAVLEQKCLRRFGFDVPIPANLSNGKFRGIDGRYGLADPEHARTFGYHERPWPKGMVTFESRLPYEALPAMNGKDPDTGQDIPSTDSRGIPPGGCFKEAIRALFDGTDSASQSADVVEGFVDDALKKATSDPRLDKPMAAWRACGKKAGYTYGTPHQVIQSWQTKTAGADKPNQEEIDAAVIDVRCKNDSGLLGTWIAVNIDNQRKALEANAEKVKQYKQERETHLKNAARIIAAG